MNAAFYYDEGAANVLNELDLSGVVAIGEYAFFRSDISEVIIPDGYEIPEGAFAHCNSITKVVIGDNVLVGKNAFYNEAWHAQSEIEEREFYDAATGKKIKKNVPVFSVVYDSSIKSITIGKNATLLSGAFYGAAKVEKVTLGDGAVIEDYAFYNCTSLKDIDLSKVISIGESAFSGDIHYKYQNDSCTIVDITPAGEYQYTYHAPQLVSVDLSSLESIGMNAFAVNKSLTTVVLGTSLKEIAEGAFQSCYNLTTVNLGAVELLGDYAFAECNLKVADLTKAYHIGKYAFCYNEELTALTLGASSIDIGEGAFSYCNALADITGEENVTYLGDYAFAYSDIRAVDLSSATYIGTHAFFKE